MLSLPNGLFFSVKYIIFRSIVGFPEGYGHTPFRYTFSSVQNLWGLVEEQEQLRTTRWWRMWTKVLDKFSYSTWGGWSTEEVSWHASTHSVSYNLISNSCKSPSVGFTLDRRTEKLLCSRGHCRQCDSAGDACGVLPKSLGCLSKDRELFLWLLHDHSNVPSWPWPMWLSIILASSHILF